MDQVHGALGAAETIAKAGGTEDDIRLALAARAREFEAPQFVPLDALEGVSLVTVEGQILIFGDDPSGRRDHPFAAMFLNGPDGNPLGAGGWWFNPRAFLAEHLRDVVLERLTSSRGMYGGLELTRHLSVTVLDEAGNEIAHVREPSQLPTARTVAMVGPFEGYQVRVSATATAPAAIADRLVGIEVSFIGLLALVLLGATFVGARYILRQIELVNAKTSFVSNVTHELKTPIAVIKLAVETIELGRYRGEAERDKYLRTITRESDRLAQLVDNILDFRLEAGQRLLHRAPLDMRDVVNNAMDGFKLRLEDAGFQYEVVLPDQVPKVLGGQSGAPALPAQPAGQRGEVFAGAEGRAGGRGVTEWSGLAVGIGPRHRDPARGARPHLREVRPGRNRARARRERRRAGTVACRYARPRASWSSGSQQHTRRRQYVHHSAARMGRRPRHGHRVGVLAREKDS